MQQSPINHPKPSDSTMEMPNFMTTCPARHIGYCLLKNSGAQNQNAVQQSITSRLHNNVCDWCTSDLAIDKNATHA